MGLMNVEDWIKSFAKKKRIEAKDFPAFREKILFGLRQLKLSDKEIDLEKYKEVVKSQKELNSPSDTKPSQTNES